MKDIKGFSLIELMITVAIIGILSLMALPVYQNYVTKVKLTELLLKHVYLSRQIDIEMTSGGVDAVYSFLKSKCVSDINEYNIGWLSLRCKIDPDIYGDTIDVDRHDNSINLFFREDGRTTQAFIFLLDKRFMADWTYVKYYLEDGSFLYFDFVRGFPELADYSAIAATESGTIVPTVDIQGSDGRTRPMNNGQWLCSIAKYLPDGGLVRVPKSIRPSMCPYLSSGNRYLLIEE